MAKNDIETEEKGKRTITVSKNTFEKLKNRKENLSLNWDNFLSAFAKAIDEREISNELEFWSFVEDEYL